jgi:transposase
VLKRLILRGPSRRDGVSTWRIADLCDLAERRFGVRYAESGMLRLVHALGVA